MPGATWFPGATLNYAEHVLRMPGLERRRSGRPRVLADPRADHAHRRGSCASRSAASGPGCAASASAEGDRVAAYAPNIPETYVLMLATASLGAVFSSCAPEFGTRSVIDRWSRSSRRCWSRSTATGTATRRSTAAREVAGDPGRAAVSLEHVVDHRLPARRRRLGRARRGDDPLEFAAVPFDHPLYVLYSLRHHGPAQADRARPRRDPARAPQDAGAAPRPRPGRPVLLVHHDRLDDVELPGSAARRSARRSCCSTATPATRTWAALWRARGGGRHHLLRHLGAVPAGLPQGRHRAARARRPDPAARRRLDRRAAAAGGLRLGLRGGRAGVCSCSRCPAAPTCAPAFVGGAPLLPVIEGEIACRCLGARVEAYDPTGKPVIGELGELVITAPMPSMPVGFWNDPDGRRYREAYFDVFPGVWRHGDWITIGARRHLRDHRPLRRHAQPRRRPAGHRRVLLRGGEPRRGRRLGGRAPRRRRPDELLLFVVLADGVELDDALRGRIRAGAAHRAVAAARARTRSTRYGRCRAPCPARSWRCR